MLNEIVSLLQLNPEKEEIPIIPHHIVRQWMESENIDVLGAIYALITKNCYYSKITPPLQFEDYFQFILIYFQRCFLENPTSEWADSRYSAGWDFVNWFKHFWDDKSLSPKHMKILKDWLEKLYKIGDDELQKCLITAVLEHLFEQHAIANFFSDWQSDPVLKDAYRQALEWQQSG